MDRDVHDTLSDLDDDELQALVALAKSLDGPDAAVAAAEVGRKHRDRSTTRRDLLKAGGAVGVGALLGGGATGAASAQADDTDSVPDVGTPSQPVDVFGDGISANEVSAEEVNITSIRPERSEWNPSNEFGQQPEQSGPATLRPYSYQTNPVLTKSDVSDVSADFVADPFVVLADGVYHMFLEVMYNTRSDKSIGHATSTDGINWDYQGLVLDTSTGMSFPYTFRAEGQWYMAPSTGGEVALYTTSDSDFPGGWSKDATLVDSAENMSDSVIIPWEGRWYVLGEESNDLKVFYADSLTGSYSAHPNNPVISSSSTGARPAGRPIVHHGWIELFTMMNFENFGNGVLSQAITDLSPTSFTAELLTDSEPLIVGNRNGEWNWKGMHHVNVVPQGLSGGGQIAIVDGHKEDGSGNSEWAIGVYEVGEPKAVTKAYLGSDQTITGDGSFQKVAYDTVSKTTTQKFDTADNHWNVRYPGDYHVSATIRMDGLTDGTGLQLTIYKNDARVARQEVIASGTSESVTISAVLPDMSPPDELDIRTWQDSGGDSTVVGLEELSHVSFTRL